MKMQESTAASPFGGHGHSMCIQLQRESGWAFLLFSFFLYVKFTLSLLLPLLHAFLLALFPLQPLLPLLPEPELDKRAEGGEGGGATHLPTFS